MDKAIRASLTIISGGANATGIALALSSSSSSSSSIVSSLSSIDERILINAGDSCQLICGSMKMKLKPVRYLLLSSLAPHHVSGIPGIVHSLSDLGNEILTIIGPHGIDMLLESMQPLMNRQYPRLIVQSISGHANIPDVCTRCFRIQITAVFAAQQSMHPLALKYSITMLDGLSTLPIPLLCQQRCPLEIVPVELSFPTQPSIDELISGRCSNSSSSYSESEDNAVEHSDTSRPSLVSSTPVVVLVPMTVSSLTSNHELDHFLLTDIIPEGMRAIFILCMGDLRFEAMCPTSHEQARILNLLCPQLFPVVPHLAAVSSSHDASSSVNGVPLSVVHQLTTPCDEQLHSSTEASPSINCKYGWPLILQGQAGLSVKIAPVSPSCTGNHCSDTTLLEILQTNEFAVRRSMGSDDILPLSQSTKLETIREVLSKNATSELPLEVVDASSDDGPIDNYSSASRLRQLLMTGKRKASEIDDVSHLSKLPMSSCSRSSSLSTITDIGGDNLRHTLSDAKAVLDSCVSEPAASDTFNVTFLGTGSAAPSQFRRNSCILISFPSIAIDKPSVPPPQLVVPLFSGSNCTALPLHPPSLVILGPHNVGPILRPPPPPGPPPRPPSNVTMGPNCHGETPGKAGSDKRKLPPLHILLDAGDGACSQLFTHCHHNREQFYECLLQLKVIWISHHHADHICGIPLLFEHLHLADIYRRRRRFPNDSTIVNSIASIERPKVMVIAPPTAMHYIEFMLMMNGLEEYVQLIPTHTTQYVGITDIISDHTQGRLSRLISVPVLHCKDSYGVVLSLRNFAGRDNEIKMVYSGDCRPSQALVTAGLQADILIHEATFADDMASDAVTKRHCTTSEAKSIATRMRVGSKITGRNVPGLTILTHFSQRYPAIAPHDEVIESSTRSASTVAMGFKRIVYAAAFDGMNISYPSQVYGTDIATNTIAKVYSLLES